MELKGKLVAKCGIQEGESAKGTWRKQTIVIETGEQYPKKVAVLLWNDIIEKAEAFNNGDKLTIQIDIESREFPQNSGKYFTDVKAWKIEKEGVQADAPAPQAPAPPLPPTTDDWDLNPNDNDLKF